MGAAMPSADEPTMGEVIRRLDQIAAQLTDIVKEIKDDRAENAKTFVRQDVYLANRLADQATVANFHADIGAMKVDVDRDVAELRTERAADVSFRRQAWLAMAGIAISTLVAIALAVVNILVK